MYALLEFLIGTFPTCKNSYLHVPNKYLYQIFRVECALFQGVKHICHAIPKIILDSKFSSFREHNTELCKFHIHVQEMYATIEPTYRVAQQAVSKLNFTVILQGEFIHTLYAYLIPYFLVICYCISMSCYTLLQSPVVEDGTCNSGICPHTWQ